MTVKLILAYQIDNSIRKFQLFLKLFYFVLKFTDTMNININKFKLVSL